ncbi:MAG: hypothetical protein KDD53_04895, partial [Bdellovibrionales bacterium]|nr:hypothetical protein [Bdellovibrionales bacterium]
YRPLVSLAGELLGPNITVSFHKIIFKDSLFYKTYIENLTRISQSRYLSEFWESIAGKLRQEMNILHKSYPYYAVSDEYLKQNQEVIRNVLARQDLLLATVRLVDSAFVEIEAENASKFPLEIVSLSVNGIDNFKSAKEKVLAPRWEGDEARREKIRFLAPTSDLFDGELQHAEVHYRILGNPDTVNSTSVSIEKDQSPSPLLPINMKGNLDEFDFVKPIKDSTQVRISKGSWTITKDLVVPADTPLLIEAGASLDLQNNALILSKAPLTIRGSKDSPVKIYSSDNTGQGVVVTSVASTSVVENTNFSGLSYPHRPGWELTGSVTFYESPVEISDSSFALNHSEDAINIVRTHFSLVNVLFDRTAGDAFDADFTRGLIANSRFVNLGNDAIDVSGSDVELSNIVIENPGDKGVSVGENSRVRAVGISVAGGKVGVASKDLSNLVGEDFVVDGSEIGFAAFQKKPNFGPSSISLKNLKLKSSKTLFLIEKNSKMSVDGKRIPDSAEKVRDQLYGE